VTAEAADVAVVGAGITRLAVARALKLRGAGVIVLERRDRIHRASAGGVRQRWVRRRLSPARESAALGEAETELDFPVDLGFRACGCLFAAHSETAPAPARTSDQNGEGVPSRTVSPEAAAAPCPGFDRAHRRAV
jgi:glycine/D-amino acid oxidase-like deaminating enzyme